MAFSKTGSGLLQVRGEVVSEVGARLRKLYLLKWRYCFVFSLCYRLDFLSESWSTRFCDVEEPVPDRGDS